MKQCACCGLDCESSQHTCANCGEASWYEMPEMAAISGVAAESDTKDQEPEPEPKSEVDAKPAAKKNRR